MSNILELIIQSKDRASQDLKNIAGQLRKVGIDAGGAAVELAKTYAAFKTMQLSARATSFIAKSLKPAVSVAADLQQALAEVGAELTGDGFKGSALTKMTEEARKTAIEISGLTGQPVNDLVKMQAKLLEARVPFDELGNSAKAAGLIIRKTGLSDMGSFVRTASQFKVRGAGFGDFADTIGKISEKTGMSGDQSISMLKNVGMASGAFGLDMAGSAQLATILARQNIMPKQAQGGLDAFAKAASTSKNLKGLGLAEQIDKIRESTSKMDSITRDAKLVEWFGGGSDVVRALLQSDVSLKEMNDEWKRGLTLQQEADLEGKNLNENMKKLAESGKTLSAQLFKPMSDWLNNIAVSPARKVLEGMAKGVGANGGAANGVSGAAVGTVAAGVGVTALAGILMAKFGGGMLKKLGGIANINGLVAGFAKGKVAEAMGVQPVYVTNATEVGAAAGGGLLGTKKDGVVNLEDLDPLGQLIKRLIPMSNAFKWVGGAAGGALVVEQIADMVMEPLTKGRYANLEEVIVDAFSGFKISKAYDAVNNININIDKDGRARIDETGHAITNVKARRGSFADALQKAM
jgi:hypothetical protein